jgi:hypothetical protein
MYPNRPGGPGVPIPQRPAEFPRPMPGDFPQHRPVRPDLIKHR